jgi:glycosyltransferase involved in cell wall biosynthesis
MNIVCVSHNAPPLNDAEALCTARLLSALVQAGAKVHLIAADLPASLNPDIAAEVLDSHVKITYVPANHGRLAKLRAMGRHQFHGQRVEWIAPAIKAARTILQQYENPILLTRAFPMASNLVGYYCRRDAQAWVAHFSDPYPPFEWKNHWYSRFLRPINQCWAARILNAASLVTVTCRNAIRYIEEKSGVRFREKAEVVTHLALPKLKSGAFRLERTAEEFVVAHIGNLMNRRRPDLLLKGALIAMEQHPEIRFLQYGNVDPEILAMCHDSSAFQRLDIRHIDNLSPRDAADLQAQVDVNVIVDTDLGLPYSPFILSKFPHSVCTGKPLLMLSSADSEMARLTKLHGGGEFVGFSTPEAVAQAIGRLFARRREALARHALTEYATKFSPEHIVPRFMERLEQLAKRN